MTTASICAIGDEILIGQVVDTNSSMISRSLQDIGVKVTSTGAIPDDRKTIIAKLSNLLIDNDIIITTGGLGPTKDDITKQALAEISGSQGWYTHEGQLAIVKRILSSRGLDILDINIAQASVPEKCEVIENKRGTAPIMVFRFEDGRFGQKKTLYSLPGVPFEAEAALPDIIEDIRLHYGTGRSYHRTVMTYGLAESALSKKIEVWEDSLPSKMHLAYLPNPLTGVRLRLSAYGCTDQDEKDVDNEVEKLANIIGEYIYSYEDDTLQNTVGRLLKKNGRTMSAAESCTGGTISQLITSIPGSSEYYLGSVTSYAISVKEKILGVPDEIIQTYGVVSAECAAKMAEGVRKATGSDYSVATTGYAGPGGGTVENPSGTVWVAVSSEKGTETARFMYKNDRKRNIERFAASALDFLRKKIEIEK